MKNVGIGLPLVFQLDPSASKRGGLRYSLGWRRGLREAYIPAPFRRPLLSRLACSRRAASLRLGQNPSGPPALLGLLPSLRPIRAAHDGLDAQSLISISTPAGSSRLISASTVLGEGFTTSISRLWVRRSNCSRESLYLWGYSLLA